MGTGPYGSVMVSDFEGGVTIDVTLPTGWLFVNTGNGNHEAFAFNLNNVFDPAGIKLTGDSVGRFSIDTTLPALESGLGQFAYGITVNGGNGYSNGQLGPLHLSIEIAGLNTSNFVKNEAGYYFAADVSNGSGGGLIAANIVTPAVPEPSSWAMMILGFAGVGLLAYRRREVAFRLV